MPPRKKQETTELPDEPVLETPAEDAEVDTEADIAGDIAGDETPADADETEAQAADAADDGGDTEADTSSGDAELVEVRGPCRRCFPDGWPAREDGAYVSCHHGLGVRFGEANFASRAVAETCGLLEG